MRRMIPARMLAVKEVQRRTGAVVVSVMRGLAVPEYQERDKDTARRRDDGEEPGNVPGTVV